MATSGSNVPQLNSIDDLVQLTLASSSDESTGNARSARALAPALKRLDKSGTPAGVSALQICTSALKDGSDALDALIPQSWTPTQPRPGLAAAYVLTQRLKQQETELSAVYNKAVAFCQSYDPYELVTFPQLYGRLAEGLHHAAFSANQEATAVQPLSQLFQGYIQSCPSGKTLTRVHPMFARVCLSTRNYDAILPFLDGPIENINMPIAPVTIQHHLLFHYYAGCILAAVQRFKEACAYFETAVVVPGSVASAISLDAYKKLVLCTLIRKGAVPTLPKFTSQPVLSAFKSHCTLYSDFATAFAKLERRQVQKIANDGREDFDQDGNWGLVLQCLERLKSQAILKLRETYVTVSLQEVAEAVQGSQESDSAVDAVALQQAETLIRALIDSKELFASIDYEGDSSSARNATVTFLSDPEPYNSAETVDMLTQKMAATARLGLSNTNLSQQMLHNKEFLKKAMATYSSGGSGAPGLYGGSAMEEDLLGEGDDI